MLAGIHVVATVLWTGVAGGAAAGFVARDALGLRQALVALAWIIGAALALLPFARRRLRSTGERGQATVELVSVVLLVALALVALVAVGARLEGRSFGGFLAFRVACTIGQDCHGGDQALAKTYAARDAALVRELAPNLVYERGERQLPVDWRRCRRPVCADAPDEPGLDAHRTRSGDRVTAFTRVIRRHGRTYIQYWLYYPDSRSVWARSDELWDWFWGGARRLGLVRRPPSYPGAHRDDWEAYVVRLDPDGRAWVRASSHGHWQGCKEARCRNRWTGRTGWTRVSRGSHAGHIPVPLELHERTTTGEGLRLIPLETLDRRAYRPLDDGVLPPWRKDAYRDPESDDS